MATGVATLLYYGVFLLVLVGAAVVDIKTRRIPNVLVAVLLICWCCLSLVFWGSGEPWAWRFICEGFFGFATLGGGMLLFSVLYERYARKASIGGGDIKLLAMVGLYMGFECGILCLFIACLAAVLLSLAPWRMKGAERGLDCANVLSKRMPFAPFILIGAVVAMLL